MEAGSQPKVRLAAHGMMDKGQSSPLGHGMRVGRISRPIWKALTEHGGRPRVWYLKVQCVGGGV